MKRLVSLLLVLNAMPVQAQFLFKDSAAAHTANAGGNDGAVSALVGAREQATIYRVRASVGGDQYRQKIVCTDSNVDIGSNSSQPAYVGSLVVVSGGVCPGRMQQGH